jgi:protein-disulfide isomerase
MSKKSKFVKNSSPTQNQNPYQALLVPVSIILAGVIIAVSFLIGSTAVINKLEKTVESSVASAVKNAGLTGTAATPTQEPVKITNDQIKELFNRNDVVKFGSADAKVTFIEFSDPSCPYCHAAAGLNGELNKQMGTQFVLTKDGGSYVAPVVEMKKLVEAGKAAYVWLYDNGHGNGELSTQALYCAYEKGKFWQVHDRMMTSEGYTIINDIVKNDKANIGKLTDFLKNDIDANELKSCLESGKHADKTGRDMQIAQSFGSSGTPGFFVNTTNFAGAYSFTDMQSTVNAALQ